MTTTSGTYPVTHYPRCVLWGKQLTRPTTSFARGCKLWSRERQFYEDVRRSNMEQFSDRPYLYKQYPEIGKHYPGTWRTVNQEQLSEIVTRLTKPTRAHTARAEDIRERTEYVRFIVDTEKAKDIIYRTYSAAPRLQGLTPSSSSCPSANSSRDNRRRFISASGNNRKCAQTAWGPPPARGPAPEPETRSEAETESESSSTLPAV